MLQAKLRHRRSHLPRQAPGHRPRQPWKGAEPECHQTTVCQSRGSHFSKDDHAITPCHTSPGARSSTTPTRQRPRCRRLRSPATAQNATGQWRRGPHFVRTPRSQGIVTTALGGAGQSNACKVLPAVCPACGPQTLPPAQKRRPQRFPGTARLWHRHTTDCRPTARH